MDCEKKLFHYNCPLRNLLDGKKYRCDYFSEKQNLKKKMYCSELTILDFFSVLGEINFDLGILTCNFT